MRFFSWPDVASITVRLSWGLRDVGVMLTTEEHIRRLNRRYRQKDKPTDILSFPFHKVTRRPRLPLPCLVPLPATDGRVSFAAARPSPTSETCRELDVCGGRVGLECLTVLTRLRAT